MGTLHDALAPHVERGDMPGLIAFVARGDDVHIEVIGTKAFGDTEPLPRDAIFRIASLTKPIVAVAAMMLVDDGTLRLGDPVDDLLPELADRRVLTSIDSKLDDTVPARRAITVEDLLTFRLGFGAVMAPPDTYPIQTAEAELELRTLGPPWPPSPHTPDEWIRAFATLPLMHQPGEQWLYNTGAQVLGVLLERAAGQPLEDFLRARLFAPLGMHDTSFCVPPGKRDRFTTQYAPDPQTGELTVLDAPADSWWNRPPAMPNASGWLVSTIDDFWAFANMMRNGGDGLVSKTAIEQMTADHLTSDQRAAQPHFLELNSWGLGLATDPRDGSRAIPGGYGWDGGTGTTWRTDRERDVTGILLTQRAMTSPEPPESFADFWRAAYA